MNMQLLLREVEQVARLRLRVLTQLMAQPDDREIRLRFRVNEGRLRALQVHTRAYKP